MTFWEPGRAPPPLGPVLTVEAQAINVQLAPNKLFFEVVFQLSEAFRSALGSRKIIFRSRKDVFQPSKALQGALGVKKTIFGSLALNGRLVYPFPARGRVGRGGEGADGG